MRAIGLPEIFALFVIVAVIVVAVLVLVNTARPAANKMKLRRVLVPGILLCLITFGLLFALDSVR